MHKKCDENVKVLGKTYDQKQWILRKPGQKQQRSTQKERKSQGGHQMKKKVISALLASTMIVSLVACGSTGSGWFCSGIQRTPDDELLPRHPGRPRGGSPCRRRRPVAYPVADCSSVFQTGYRNHRPVYIRWLLERVFPGPGINEQRDELSVTDLHPSDLRSDPGRRNPDCRAVSAVSTEL